MPIGTLLGMNMVNVDVKNILVKPSLYVPFYIFARMSVQMAIV
jgi:hypothetical protein